MNQNNFNNTNQMISQENLQQQTRTLTQEELQKTQVLNLKDVEEAVRYEKSISKKPAIIVAVFGMIILLLGVTVQVSNTLKAKAENERVEKRIAAEKKEKRNPISNMDCVLNSPNNPDGTDTVFDINYKFENGKMIGFTKTFTVNVTPNNPLGVTAVQNYITAYQAFMNPTEGYQITVTPNETGLVTTVVVDSLKLKVEQLNPIQSQHFSTSVDYVLYTDKNDISSVMSAQGYACK